MLLEHYKALSGETQVMLIDVAANPVFQSIIEKEIDSLQEDILNFQMDGYTPEEAFRELMPMKSRYDVVLEIQELLRSIMADFRENHDA